MEGHRVNPDGSRPIGDWIKEKLAIGLMFGLFGVLPVGALVGLMQLAGCNAGPSSAQNNSEFWNGVSSIHPLQHAEEHLGENLERGGAHAAEHESPGAGSGSSSESPSESPGGSESP
jgi:hypothetical protein